jgi:hypothetical protein
VLGVYKRGSEEFGKLGLDGRGALDDVFCRDENFRVVGIGNKFGNALCGGTISRDSRRALDLLGGAGGAGGDNRDANVGRSAVLDASLRNNVMSVRDDFFERLENVIRASAGKGE